MFNVRRWTESWTGVMLSLLIILLLVGPLGCGEPSEEEVPGEEITDEEVTDEEEPVTEKEEEVVDEEEPVTEEEKEEPPVSVEEWKNPTELVDVLDVFKELEWNLATIENGQETDSRVITFRNEGPETVAGKKADLLIFSENEDKFKAWVDQNGDVVQAEIDGQTIPGELAQVPLDIALEGFFLPFWSVEEMGVREFARGEIYPGYNLRDVSTQRETFGDISAEVTCMDVYLEPPATFEGDEGTVTWCIGDFDGEFQMLVEWDWGEEDAEGDINIQYNLNKAVLQ